MEFIEVEYNNELESLESLLSDVDRPGDFYVSGAMELPMPKVTVEGVGPLSFPVPEEQIAAILGRAERAPYGRGEETVLDTSVRQVWQIASSRLRISGKSWSGNFASILSKVRAGLGCEGVSVSAELYKLLVYDRDGFFLPHRDTEKARGMFGTLVVTLPSPHRGGELRIRHSGREVTVDTSGAESSEVSWVAFYADCEHEALPVREGNRVCLVYNLVQKPGKGKRKVPNVLAAPEHESQIEEAARILERFLKGPAAPAKIAWLLEHQYSPAGLSFSALKAADAARAGVLARAGARAGCAAHLGIVHIADCGSAEEDWIPDDYDRGWMGYGYEEEEDDKDIDDDKDIEDDDDKDIGDDDDIEPDTDEGASFTVITVDDSWQFVDEWRDTEDRPVEFGAIPLSGGELLPTGALDGEPPDEQRLTEASGNEGATYERSYHRAALVLWREDRYAEVLLQAGVVAALPYLRQLLDDPAQASEPAEDLAVRMVARWKGASQPWYDYGVRGPKSSDRADMLVLLARLGDYPLLERFIAQVVTPVYDGTENAALVCSASVLGPTRAGAVFSALVSARIAKRASACVDLLLALARDAETRFPGVADAVVRGLDRIGDRRARTEDSDQELREPEKRRRPIGPGFAVDLLEALGRFDDPKFRSTAVQRLGALPEAFDPVTVVVPALQRMMVGKGAERPRADSSVLHLWTRSAEFLLQRSEFPPEPPSDWRMEVKLSCSCDDCRELQAFTLDPHEHVHRFRVNKQRRRHLHDQIGSHRLDMAHVTERRGSPYTLVSTKDRRSFDRRQKQYRGEIGAMRTLVELAPTSDSATDLSARMQAAALAAD